MPSTVVVGAQWGDEGKGKIVDLLAQQSDVVCRYQGGPNAGHTIVVDGETWKLRQMPSGVVSGTTSVIGAGCVVDPQVFVDEVDLLLERGIDPSIVVLSGNAHLIMPWHVTIDQASERRLGKLQIGTTRRGIGPAYADKASRIGIRVQDVLDPKILRAEDRGRARREEPLARADLRGRAVRPRGGVGAVRRATPSGSRRSSATCRCSSTRRCATASACCSKARRRRCSTSTTARIRSSPRRTRSRRARRPGSASARRASTACSASRKAYVTRVGEGPFPSEIEGPDQERLRELGGEYGTVTGRERRCGWLDLVALRYAVRVNGMTSLALTKLDVLSAFAELPVCVRYRLRDGSETEHFPAHQSDFHHAPAGVGGPAGLAAAARRRGVARASCRAAARAYVEFVSRELDVPIELVGVGAARERVLV